MKEYSSTFSSGFTATAPPLSPVWSTTVLHCRCSAFDLSGGASPSTLLHQYHAATHLVACGMTASNASSCIHHDSTPEVLLSPGQHIPQSCFNYNTGIKPWTSQLGNKPPKHSANSLTFCLYFISRDKRLLQLNSD